MSSSNAPVRVHTWAVFIFLLCMGTLRPCMGQTVRSRRYLLTQSCAAPSRDIPSVSLFAWIQEDDAAVRPDFHPWVTLHLHIETRKGTPIPAQWHIRPGQLVPARSGSSDDHALFQAHPERARALNTISLHQRDDHTLTVPRSWVHVGMFFRAQATHGWVCVHILPEKLE